MGRLYTGRLLRSLRSKLAARAAEFDGRVDLQAGLAARSFREFDDAVTAPLHGFRDADDYYEQSSSGQFLGSIRVPTRIIQARDDPFVPGHCIPRADESANPWVDLRVSDGGGHVGFVAGSLPWRPVLWAERETARFIAERVIGGSAKSTVAGTGTGTGTGAGAGTGRGV